MKTNMFKKSLYFSLLSSLATLFGISAYLSNKPNVDNSIRYISSIRQKSSTRNDLKMRFSNDTNLTPQQLGFKLVPIGKEEDGIYIKMPDFSLNQKGAEEILKTYASLPSNIITSSPKLKDGANLTGVDLEPGLDDELEDEELEALASENDRSNRGVRTTQADEEATNITPLKEENDENDANTTPGFDIEHAEAVNNTNLSTSFFSNNPLNNIFSILEIDRTKHKWFYDVNNTTTLSADAPIAFNLTNRTTYIFNNQNVNVGGDTNAGTVGQLAKFNLVTGESLPAFELASNNNELVLDQQYFDKNGILAIQLVLSQTANPRNKDVYYILISGFNVRLNNNSNGNRPILANADYLNSVNSISDETLLNSLQVESNATNPTNKTVSQDSRKNDPATGSISIDVDYEWKVPQEVKFRNNFAGVTSSDSSVVTTGIALNANNQQSVDTNWTKNYTFSGFVAASAFNNQQTLVLASSLSVGLLAALLLTYLIVYLVRRYIAKR